MTYEEAIKKGYTDADTKYQRGYISRKVNTMEQPVQEARGSRKGELYVLLPCFTSTQYCIRQYLRKDAFDKLAKYGC